MRRDLAFGGGRVNGSLSCDPFGFGACLAVCAAMDIGEAMRETARNRATSRASSQRGASDARSILQRTFEPVT